MDKLRYFVARDKKYNQLTIIMQIDDDDEFFCDFYLIGSDVTKDTESIEKVFEILKEINLEALIK